MCPDAAVYISGRINEHDLEGQSQVKILQANSLEKAKLAPLATKHGMPSNQLIIDSRNLCLSIYIHSTSLPV